MFPPGQHDTRIIPKATIGDSRSPHAMMSTKVSAGSNMIWQRIPVRIDFGFLIISTKVAGLIPNATPNITTIFSRVEPPFIVTSMASRIASGCELSIITSFISVRF